MCLHTICTQKNAQRNEEICLNKGHERKKAERDVEMHVRHVLMVAEMCIMQLF